MEFLLVSFVTKVVTKRRLLRYYTYFPLFSKFWYFLSLCVHVRKNTAVPLAGGWLCEREAFQQLPLWADPVLP